MKRNLIIMLLLLVVVACDDSTNPVIGEGTLTAKFEKINETGQWYTGFSDCPQDTAGYKINFKIADLPSSTGENGKALMMSGQNSSDDLFLYTYRKVNGLKKSAEYNVDFKLILASKYHNGSAGIGGSPANSVYVKAGLVTTKPASQIKDGDYVINIDKANQAQGGDDMKVLGDLAVPDTTTGYKLITRTYEGFSFTADSKGEAWVIVGIDSGFEGPTAIYLDKLEMKLKLKD